VGEVGQQRPPRSFWRKAGFALAFMLLLACIPALWLIGRDVFRLAIASDRIERETYENQIIRSLLDEFDRANSVTGRNRFLLHSVPFPSPCYSLSFSEIRPNYQFLPSAVSRDGRYDLHYQSISAYSVASGSVFQIARNARAREGLSAFQASALRACIAATPFASSCITHVEKALIPIDAEFDRQAVRWGLKVPVRLPSGQRGYCQAQPIFPPLGSP
jgi:hypothetical protein